MATFTFDKAWPPGVTVRAYVRYTDSGFPAGTPEDEKIANGVGTVVFSGLVGNGAYWATDGTTTRQFTADPEPSGGGGGGGIDLPSGGSAGQVLGLNGSGQLAWLTPAGGIPEGGITVDDLAPDFALPAANVASDVATQAELNAAVSSLNGVVAGQSIPFNTITGNYTAQASDFGQRIQYAGSAAIVVTIPSGLAGYAAASPGPESGKVIEVSYIGVGGSVTVVAGSGVSFIATNGSTTSAAISTQGGNANLLAVAANTYDVSGQLD